MPKIVHSIHSHHGTNGPVYIAIIIAKLQISPDLIGTYEDIILYVLLKALPPVCMKYTARDESRVANIARGEAECYICHKTLIKSCILSYKRSGSVLSVLLYFTLTEVSAKYSSLVILTHSLNK